MQQGNKSDSAVLTAVLALIKRLSMAGLHNKCKHGTLLQRVPQQSHGRALQDKVHEMQMSQHRNCFRELACLWVVPYVTDYLSTGIERLS